MKKLKWGIEKGREFLALHNFFYKTSHSGGFFVVIFMHFFSSLLLYDFIKSILATNGKVSAKKRAIPFYIQFVAADKNKNTGGESSLFPKPFSH